MPELTPDEFLRLLAKQQGVSPERFGLSPVGAGMTTRPNSQYTTVTPNDGAAASLSGRVNHAPDLPVAAKGLRDTHQGGYLDLQLVMNAKVGETIDLASPHPMASVRPDGGDPFGWRPPTTPLFSEFESGFSEALSQQPEMSPCDLLLLQLNLCLNLSAPFSALASGFADKSAMAQCVWSARRFFKNPIRDCYYSVGPFDAIGALVAALGTKLWESNPENPDWNPDWDILALADAAIALQRALANRQGSGVPPSTH